MEKRKSRWLAFGLFHLTLFSAVLAALLYALFTARFLPKTFYHCPMHDLLRLYCPFCGGTRAVGALVRLRFGEAFLLSPVCLSLLPVAAALDVRAFVLLCRGSDKPLLPRGWWWALCLWLIGGNALRNVLMLCGVEYTGELFAFWGGVPAPLRALCGAGVVFAAAGILIGAGKPLFGRRAKK